MSRKPDRTRRSVILENDEWSMLIGVLTLLADDTAGKPSADLRGWCRGIAVRIARELGEPKG